VIEPGINVVFRADGRVQHSVCPQVTCPVCSRAIQPHDPIRRDGDAILHGNCWLRRPSRTAEIAKPPAEADGNGDRTKVICAKLAAGMLPVIAPTKLWSRYGAGQVCDGCGERVPSGAVEYALDFSNAKAMRLHPDCHAIWEKERGRHMRGMAGGSTASPWTLVFDLRIARRAAADRAACAELLSACAETRAVAARTRILGRMVAANAAALRQVPHAPVTRPDGPTR
jgi:hypothetical protein